MITVFEGSREGNGPVPSFTAGVGTPARAAVVVVASLWFALAPGAAAAAPPVPQPPPAALLYTIEPGDTLLGIGRRLLARPGNWVVVQRINGIKSPRRLTPGTQIRIPYSLVNGEADVAIVLRGDAGSRLDGKPMAAGDLVREAGVIETSDHSVVVLRLADGSTLRLEPASRLRLERLRRYHDDRAIEARALLERGRVEASAATQRPKPLSIRTRVATAAVRGTLFRVASGETTAAAEVLEGGVDWRVFGQTARGQPSTTEVQDLVLLPGFGAVADPTKRVAQEALLPAVDLHGLPDTIGLTQQTLPFPPVAGAVRYRIEINRENVRQDGSRPLAAVPPDRREPGAPIESLADSLRRQDLTLVASRVVDAPRIELTTIDDGRHRIEVRPIAASGLEGLPARATIDVQARPLPPTVGRPMSDAAVFGERTNFEWSMPLGIDRFRIELAAEPTFATLLATETVNGPRTSLDVQAGGDQPAVRYWRVASVRPDGSVGPFAQSRFVWYPGPPQPSMNVDAHDRMSVRWLGQPGQRYRLQLANEPEFRAPRVIEVDRPQLALDHLQPGRYYLRVQAIAPGGEESPFNVPQMFEIKSVVLTGDGTPLQSGGGLDVEASPAP
ncbi:MAG: FecR domain-containing protein [Burkholderiaceae bacterium]